MKVFILEDDPLRIEEFIRVLSGPSVQVTIVHSVKEGKDAWNPPYDLISLDHDLGGEQMVDSSHENTGYTFVKEVMGPATTFNNRGTLVLVHSYNPDGARNMVKLLGTLGWAAIRYPFGPPLLSFIKDFK